MTRECTLQAPALFGGWFRIGQHLLQLGRYGALHPTKGSVFIEGEALIGPALLV